MPFVSVALVLTVQVNAQSPSRSPDILTQVSARGRLLQAYDQAASHASDAAMSLAGAQTAGLELFIARPTTSGWLVDFGKLDAKANSFLTAIEASGPDGQHFTAQRFSPPRADIGFLVAAALAIKTAEAAFQPVPKRRYNVAVLANADATMYVYLYPAQTDTNVYPLGGDERYKISADGLSILEDHRMHRTILDLAAPQPTKGQIVVAGVHTDLYSDIPEDTDVFHVLARKPPMPDYVSARNHFFLIHPDGSIEPKNALPHSFVYAT